MKLPRQSRWLRLADDRMCSPMIKIRAAGARGGARHLIWIATRPAQSHTA